MEASNQIKTGDTVTCASGRWPNEDPAAPWQGTVIATWKDLAWCHWANGNSTVMIALGRLTKVDRT